jgi:hypothetical protein
MPLTPGLIRRARGSLFTPNEPSGFTAISSQPWDAKPPNLNAVDAYGWGFNRDAAQVNIVTDATAPRSPSNVADGLFDPAWFTANNAGQGGTAPFSIERPFGRNVTSIYQACWHKHSANFSDSGNIGTKCSFFRGAGSNHYWGFESADATDEFFFLVELQSGGGDRTLRTSAGGDGTVQVFQAIPKNVWRRYEVLAIGNHPPAADGILRVWVDGVKIMEATNVAWFAAGQSWNGIAWEPVYGGGLHAPSALMHMFVDHWYVSAP